MFWWTLRQLNAEDWKARESAAKKLGDLKDVRAVDQLVAALKDKYSGVRRAAEHALVEIGRTAVRPLVTGLKVKNQEARQAAEDALVRIGSPAVAALGQALYERDLAAREAAAAALGKIGNSSAMEQLLAALKFGESGVKEAAAAGLVRIGPPTVKSLAAALKDNRAGVRDTAAAVLVRIGPSAIEPLVDALRDSDVREVATEALWKIDPNWAQSAAARAAVPGLVALLQDGDERLRRSAATVLGNIENAEAAEALLAALRDPDEGVQEAAATALGQIGDPRAILPLVAALKGGAVKARKAIAEALARIGSALVDPLVKALKSKDAAVREATAAVLVRVGNSVVEPLVDALWKIDPEWAKSDAARIALPRFVAALKEGGGKLLRDSEEALKKAGEFRLIKPLMTTLKDKGSGVAKVGASLGHSKNARDVDVLSQALDDPDSNVRAAAIESLMEIAANAEEPLVAALKDKNHVVRRTAAHALADCGDLRARETLRNDLSDDSDLVVLDAAESLFKLGEITLVSPLLKVLQALSDALTPANGSQSYRSRRTLRLLNRLLEQHSRDLSTEDLDAILNFQGGAKEPFISSVDPSGRGFIAAGQESPPASLEAVASFAQARNMARREISRRKLKVDKG